MKYLKLYFIDIFLTNEVHDVTDRGLPSLFNF